MAESWFLAVDGIPGGSTAAGHEDEIDVLAWSWGVSASDSSGGFGGAGRAGRPTIDALEVEARISAASPRLLDACARNRHIEDVVLTGVRDGEPGQEFLRYALTDVVVTSVQQGHLEDEGATELVAYRFAGITVAFTPLDPSGGPAEPVVVELDVGRSF